MSFSVPGYLYIMFNDCYEYYGNHFYKLGRTHNPVQRMTGYRTPFLDKSLQGSMAFFVVSLIVSAIWTWIFEYSSMFFFICIVGSILATIAEASTTRFKLDDNLAVPLAFAGSTWILTILLSISLS